MAVIRIGLSVLLGCVWACDTSTLCGRGRRLAENSRDGARIRYCIGDYGRAFGPYSCELLGTAARVDGAYRFNKKVGQWTYRDPNGQVVRTEVWRDGKRTRVQAEDDVGASSLLCDGHVILPGPEEPEPLPDLSVGWSRESSEAGEIQVRWYPATKARKRWQAGAYRHGTRDGLWTYYYRDGTLRARGRFAVGLPDGLWELWPPDGGRGTRGVYRQGTLVRGEDVVAVAASSLGVTDPQASEITAEEVRRTPLNP